MKMTFSQFGTLFVLSSLAMFLTSTLGYAQKDTVEFKFIPKYYPENDTEFISMPQAKVAHSPKLTYPADAKLHGIKADVWIKVLVDQKGNVIDALVLKSSDGAFNEYAIAHAKQYTFKWSREWPDNFQNTKGVWMSIPVRFRP